jgi:hypothetical protein
MASERSAPNDRLLDLYRRVFSSKYDWRFEGASFALAVEVKISPRTPFNVHQLSSHHRALTDRTSEFAGKACGLLVVTPIYPHHDDLISVRRHRAFLGVILWNEVLTGLRAIPLSPEDLGSRWRHLLQALTYV